MTGKQNDINQPVGGETSGMMAAEDYAEYNRKAYNVYDNDSKDGNYVLDGL